MKTIQGIEFNYDDIVLFHLSESKVNILVNNEEQMAKYKETGNIKIYFSAIFILNYN